MLTMPSQIIESFQELIGAFGRSWRDTRAANARHILRAVESFPWLTDHIDCDTLALARSVAK